MYVTSKSILLIDSSIKTIDNFLIFQNSVNPLCTTCGIDTTERRSQYRIRGYSDLKAISNLRPNSHFSCTKMPHTGSTTLHTYYLCTYLHVDHTQPQCHYKVSSLIHIILVFVFLEPVPSNFCMFAQIV